MVRRPQPYVFESFGVCFTQDDRDSPGDYDKFLRDPGAIGLFQDILSRLGERAIFKSRLLTQKDDYWFNHLSESYHSWLRRGSPDEKSEDIPLEGLQESMRSKNGPKHWDIWNAYGRPSTAAMDRGLLPFWMNWSRYHKDTDYPDGQYPEGQFEHFDIGVCKGLDRDGATWNKLALDATTTACNLILGIGYQQMWMEWLTRDSESYSTFLRHRLSRGQQRCRPLTWYLHNTMDHVFLWSALFECIAARIPFQLHGDPSTNMGLLAKNRELRYILMHQGDIIDTILLYNNVRSSAPGPYTQFSTRWESDLAHAHAFTIEANQRKQYPSFPGLPQGTRDSSLSGRLKATF